MPTVSINSPADNSKITEPVNIIGTASDANLIRYKLEYSIKDRNEFITFYSGTSSVTNGILGKLDPTMLRNGLYDIKLTAEDKSGNKSSVIVTYQLSGKLKVGNFTMSFTDLSIPVAGLPITIIRTYNNRNKVKGDFGVCWNLEISNLELSESEVTGKNWVQQKTGIGGLYTYYIQQEKPHYITVTYPDGRTDEFSVSATPNSNQFWPVEQTNISFPAKAGTYSSLRCLDANPNGLMVFPPVEGEVELLENWNTFDPDRYEIKTAKDPESNITTYTYDDRGNLISKTDPKGNTVTATYDTKGNVLTETDPDGNVTSYSYDAYGNLISKIDPLNNIRNYTYHANGNMISSTMTCTTPSGTETLITKYVYDGLNRVKEIIDPYGKSQKIEYNSSGKVSAEIDKLGNQTIYQYDSRGYLKKTISADGAFVEYTYDANGNRTSQIDQAGNVTEYNYDDLGRLAKVTYPDGAIFSYTYDKLGRVIKHILPIGQYETFEYDARGNMISRTDFNGNKIKFAYTNNRLTSRTYPDGSVVTFDYTPTGRFNTITRLTWDNQI